MVITVIKIVMVIIIMIITMAILIINNTNDGKMHFCNVLCNALSIKPQATPKLSSKKICESFSF